MKKLPRDGVHRVGAFCIRVNVIGKEVGPYVQHWKAAQSERLFLLAGPA